MRFEAFILPGAGSSDALMDWFERQEIQPVARDVRRDEHAAAEALAIGAGELPVVRLGDRVVVGYDPARLAGLSRGGESPAGIEVAKDAEGRLVVISVAPDGAAAGAGLREGDVIAQLGGYQVFSAEQLTAALSARRASRVTIRVRRGDELVTLAFQPAAA